MIGHPCIEKTGKLPECEIPPPAPDCSDCPIRSAGFCTEFQDVLRKIAANLAAKYAGISQEDLEEILANTVEGVLANIGNYEGRRGAKFSTWVWRIYRNKTADFFRAGNAYAEKFADTLAGPDTRVERELKAEIREIFEKSLADDSTGCVRLYLDLYGYFNTGKSRKELAAAYGMKPNTLNQKIRRCRKTMKRLFQNHVL